MAETEMKKSRFFWVLVPLVSFVGCGFLAYCISRDAEISFSKEKWLVISPKGNGRIEELEKKLDESIPITEYNSLKGRYDTLEEQYRSVTAKYGKILGIVGADVKGGDDAALETIALMAKRTREFDSDVNLSFSVIRTYVFRNKSINTQSPADDESRRDLYKHIQKFLRCLGVYKGPINGKQATTCLAVRQFQTQSGLEVDGKIGQSTLSTMQEMFEEED